MGLQVIDDVRRTAITQLKSQRLARWAGTRPAFTMDGFFAGAALLDTSKVVLAHGTPSQQATFMHIATNSLQCCWQGTADGAKSRVIPLSCSSCDTTLTLSHLTECLDMPAVRFRAKQRVALLAVLSSDASTHAWLNANKHLSLSALLIKLFPAPPDTSIDAHITHMMCGVYSARQANAAVKSLGFARSEDGRFLMRQLRLCCVDGVHAHYSVLKGALN